MIGFIFLLLATRQIYVIILNGLTSRQIRSETTGNGTHIIIAVSSHESIDEFQFDNLRKIHDPHHVDILLPLDHSQTLLMANNGLNIKVYNEGEMNQLLNQIIKESKYDNILISDEGIHLQTEGLFGAEKILNETKGPYFIVPQINSSNLTVKTLYTLNPNLAFLSLLKFKKTTRSQKKPLLESTQVAIIFRKKDFLDLGTDTNWKSSLFTSFHARAIGLKLCFGEKFFTLTLDGDLKKLWNKMSRVWMNAKESRDYSFAALLIQCLLWIFPFAMFMEYPFFAIGIIFLLLIYRFFTLIIFQENILSIVMHPIAAFIWPINLIYTFVTRLKK